MSSKRIDSRLTVSRRAVLAGSAALALGGLAPGAQAQDAGPPKKGGRLRAGLTGANTSDTFDPTLYGSEFTSIMGWTFGNSLVEVDANNRLVPELAESWESSPDMRVWRFKIRKGVTFHNGKTLVPEDVIFTLNRHRGPNSKSAMSGVMNQVAEITADGDTVVVTLSAGNADFPWVLAVMHGIIVPAGTTDFKTAIGTGPYKVAEYDPGVRLLGKRNADYWKSGAAHFDEVELLGINDPTARMNALLTGEVDAINRLNTRAVDRLRGNSAFTVLNVPGYRHATMPMRVDMAPFDNLDVRLAMKYAMDRKDILNRVLRGFGTLGNDHPVASIQEFHASELPQRDYDPEKAKFHLKKAGYTTISVDLLTAEAAFNGAVDAAVLYKEQAAACGITINVKREPDDGYFQKNWLIAPWCMSYWGGRPTADAILSLGYAADAAWNECKWKHPRFNELLVAARVEKDYQKRRGMYVEMQQLVRDDNGNLIPFFINYVYARRNTIKAGPPGGNFEMDGYRMTERWWTA